MESPSDGQTDGDIHIIHSAVATEAESLPPPLHFDVLPPTPVPHAIGSGEIAILQDFQGNQKIVRVTPKSSIYFGGKNMFPLHLLENGFYGMTFRYEKNRWIQCSKTLQSDDNLLSVDDSSINEASNQLLLYDNNIAQNLTANDILSLQKDLSGEELVDRIVENSTSFTNKTTFAQQKYVSKKKKKHLQQIVVLEPTLFNISESYYNSNPIKIAGLRFDYLSLALCYADIRLFRRVMVFDHSMGLLTSAVALKLQGTGKIFRISQVAMSSKIMREAPLSPAMLATIETLPLDLLDSDDPSNTEVFSPSLDGIAAEPPKKRPHKNPKVENSTVVESTNESLSGETFNEDSTNRETPTSSYSERLSTIDDLQTNGVNAFIGVFSSHRYYDKLQELQDLIERCLSIAHRYLQPDGKLVLFCGNMQPLAACQAFLHTTTEYLHIKFEEVFLREHQILPYRSHPIMRGSTRLVEGFLLSAIKVEKHAPRLGKVYQ